ncbi:hypothetical protein QQS21_005760 [Conoideocrella luteorostrata]|uniref:Uncharacterized protein n=1 Tax=Conoideocrella luteorostrata TaxID=1105319 RepID=A0AAJ0CP12_9HYPO|nr:hypothetical protein QQS21_005760 [Conoideocrella luteorostrata]
MSSKSYTTRELLRMRQTSAIKEVNDKLSQKLHRDTDIGEILRMSPERALPLIEEEVLESNIQDEAASEEPSVRQLDGTDAEWKYRGRTESEHAEIQPIGAPAGLPAQKDEGFQRFYKAVVSPTHVRVTAGGRIVPNTRGSSSPTAKWSKEKPGGDTSYIPRSASHCYGDVPGVPVPASVPHHAFGPFPPMFPGFMPGMHPGVAPGAHPHFSMMPWQMGMGMGNSFGMAHPAPPQMHQAKPAANAPAGSGTSEKENETVNSESSGSVRISPPDRFDHGRPFFFNGQWVMPAGGSFYPYGMAPLPGFPVPGLGAPAMMPPRFALPAVMHPAAMKLDPGMHARVASTSSTPSVAGHAAVPISSIRPSDITKKQIEVLRSSLRYFEDQLQYNKHQIDEKGMETQAKMVRQQIQHFEKNLKMQLESEQAHYPVHEHHKDASSSTPHDNGKDSTSSTANDIKSERDSSQSSVSQDDVAHPRSTKTEKSQDPFASRRPSALKQTKSASAPVSAKITPESSEDSEPVKRSSALPVSAALAPPFHPRVDSTASVPNPVTTRVFSGSSAEDVDFVQGMNESCTGSSGSESFTEKPYLIGKLPDAGHTGAGKPTGYLYGRDLTEDELRARHMYWGKAPRHLQKGLPKFDGKDFYPPSPVKSLAPASAPTATAASSPMPSGYAGNDYTLGAPKCSFDPFRSVGKSSQRPSRSVLGAATQSEHVTGSDKSVGPPFQGQQGVPLGSMPAGRSYDDFRKVISQNAEMPPDGCKDKSLDDDDGTNILFRGRKYMAAANGKNRNELWQRVWKRNKSSAAAVPGAVSSMTARGVLPNYAGHATASLTPAIANVSISPKGPSSKFTSAEDPVSSSAGPSKVENRPPNIPEVKESR